MSVQFIFGRSGSGKTHYCLESVRSELRLSPTGPSLILLVPEQATFQIEQALLTDGSLAGYHRAYVVSFARLARLILQQQNEVARKLVELDARPSDCLALATALKKPVYVTRSVLDQVNDQSETLERNSDTGSQSE